MITTEDITKRLLKMRDLKYKEFHCKLMPTVSKDVVIGVRTPDIRKFAKELKGQKAVWDFMDNLPHKYYEENNLHGVFIEQIKDYDECVDRINEFLPYVDNWATCDMISPEVFKKHKRDPVPKIAEWIKSDKTYTVRFAIGMLMKYYLDEYFDEKYIEMVIGVKSEEYYVNMMIAWYMATALAKQYDSAIKVLKQRRLSPWVHNKTIQKALESYRVDDEVKDVIRGWRSK